MGRRSVELRATEMSDEQRTAATSGRTVPWTVALDVRAAGAAVAQHCDFDGLDEAQLAGAAPEAVAAAGQRLEKFDTAVCDALHDAPVPDDLEAKLFALVAAEQAAAGCLSAAPVAEAPASELSAAADASEGQPLLTPPKRLPLGQRLARRPWLVRAAMASAAAVLVGVVSFALLRDPRVQWTAAALEATVRELHAQAQPAAPDKLHVWPELPISRYVSPRQAFASQELPAIDGLSAVAYQLRSARGTTATLYVFKCPRNENGAAWAPAPDPRPLYTQGLASSTWREDEQLYVLVVDGNERDYLEFLRFQDAAVG